MMKNVKWMALSVVIILISANVITAQHRRMHDRTERMEMKDCDTEEVRIPDLTDEQKDKIRQLRMDMMENVKPIRNQLNEKRAKLKSLTDQNELDRKQIDKLVEEMGALSTQIDKIEVNHRLDVKSILTDEQKLFLDHQGFEGRHPRH